MEQRCKYYRELASESQAMRFYLTEALDGNLPWNTSCRFDCMLRTIAPALLITALLLTAQEPNPTQRPPAPPPPSGTPQAGPVPIFRIEVVERTTPAINYLHRGGSTKVDFQGTPLMAYSKGEAKVESERGVIHVAAKFDHMAPPSSFGPEYLTYVLWAITPEGRPKNLGEVLLNGDNSKLEVTTDLQTFGLIVTAEPYFAVSQPSDVVVMENLVRNDTEGTIETMDAKYELLQRGQYVLNVDPAELRPIPLDHKTPLELYEARNAVRIARWTGAERYAADTLNKAETSLQNAEDELRGKIGKKTVAQNSRDAAQNAEDARLITIRRMEEEAAGNEKAAAAQREAEARAQASQAQSERESAERAKTDAERAQAEAQSAAESARRDQSEAETARAAALAQQQAAQAEADKARQVAAQAEQEKVQLREQLRQQLNTILETRETARGLIVNMSDVLFDTGKYTLKPGAREKLAKISGIILAHPGLRLEVEGHTDSVGSDEYNQRLSEQRADSVREYLVSQSVTPDLITARGFGKSKPVASNDTATGRQQNRRVELVVSGEAISASMGSL
jgi:outer membrane protein OmpA-like peptidoglycan-associated protein